MSNLSSGDELPTSSFRYDTAIRPIQHRKTRGEEYSQEYGFDEVKFDVSFRSAFPDKANWEVDGDVLYYRWPGEPPVQVLSDSVNCMGSSRIKRAEKQAYHCLSMLDAAGAVIGWRKL